MKKIIYILVILGVFTNIFASEENLLKASNSLQLILRENNANVMSALIQRSKAVVIFPDVIRAGFILGGLGGKGVMVSKNDGEWQNISEVKIGGGSVGLQVGFENLSLVFFVLKDKTAQDMLNSKVALGADASYSLGSLNNNISRVTDIKFTNDIYVFASSKGVFAGASLMGSYISANNNAYKTSTYGSRQLFEVLNNF